MSPQMPDLRIGQRARRRPRLVAGIALAALLSCTAAAGAADRPHDMYAAALARERDVRTALDAPDDPVTPAQVRAVVAAYEEIVRQHPASGYTDNALWQGGRLAADAFLKFGQLRDRNTAARLLKLLAAGYPTSKLVKEVPDQLARLDAAPSVVLAEAAEETSRSPGSAARPPKVATIMAIRRTLLPDAVRITIEFDSEVAFHDERILNPVRVFVDLPSTRAVPSLVDRTLRFDGDNDIVHQVRIGRHSTGTTRVVLDAAGVSSYSVYPLYAPFRLVIDCVREPAAVMPPVQLAARRLPAEWGRDLPSAVLPAPVARPAPEIASPAVVATPPPTAPLRASTDRPVTNLGGGYSLARQLGLKVSRIVIDPGHGGHDPGAKGKTVDESELVLDIALRVEKLLQNVPGTEVILTRRDDEFVPLQERTAIANREGADLFLSIHANASENAAARGVETYFLNFASNMTAASVAARENAASGQAMSALPDFLRAIALNNKLDESRDFATEVQRALVAGLRKSNSGVRDLGVKQAPFAVLIGAAMPSVLAEISFVTNPQEAKLLKGNTYRQRIAESLVAAIRKYQTSLNSVAKIAYQ
jgi:N-acetylmuramoyl-L-alanine amidase